MINLEHIIKLFSMSSNSTNQGFLHVKRIYNKTFQTHIEPVLLIHEIKVLPNEPRYLLSQDWAQSDVNPTAKFTNNIYILHHNYFFSWLNMVTNDRYCTVMRPSKKSTCTALNNNMKFHRWPLESSSGPLFIFQKGRRTDKEGGNAQLTTSLSLSVSSSLLQMVDDGQRFFRALKHFEHFDLKLSGCMQNFVQIKNNKYHYFVQAANICAIYCCKSNVA